MRIAKYQLENKCQYAECGAIFYCAHRRKYCSFECSEFAQGKNRHMDKLDKDPTPEEIAAICRRIRSGELVVCGDGQNRIAPNWGVSKR